jgi:hypothetical protein
MFLDAMCVVHICKINCEITFHISMAEREAANKLLCSSLMIDCNLYIYCFKNLRQLVLFMSYH